MMHAILLFSHGSTLCGAGQTLFQTAQRMEARGDAPIVEAGFLNYSEPPFEEAFEKCVARGAQKITIAPYFLVAGYFVQVSLPPKIEAMQEKFPSIKVQVAQALMTHELLADAIESCAARAQKPDFWRDLLDDAPRFCRDSSECPLHGTAKCPATSEGAGKSREVAGETSEVVGKVGEVDSKVGEARGKNEGETEKSLLVMVHGSPRAASNAHMFAVVEKVRQRGRFCEIEVGFMECNEPDIPGAIENLVARGAQNVVAVPYFLHAGTHVADDLPTLLEAAQQKFPGVSFLMGDYLGRDESVADVVAERVREVC